MDVVVLVRIDGPLGPGSGRIGRCRNGDHDPGTRGALSPKGDRDKPPAVLVVENFRVEREIRRLTRRGPEGSPERLERNLLIWNRRPRGFVEHPEVAVQEAHEMVGARRAHRVGGDHVSLGVRGIAKPREAAVERRRQGGGRRSKKWGREGRLRQRQPGLSCRPGSPWNSTKGDGTVLRYCSFPEGGERTDLIDRLPDERDTHRDLRSGRRRRLGSRGNAGSRDGEEEHAAGTIPRRKRPTTRLSWKYLPGFILTSCRCHSPPGESCGNGSPCPPVREEDASSPGP